MKVMGIILPDFFLSMIVISFLFFRLRIGAQV